MASHVDKSNQELRSDPFNRAGTLLFICMIAHCSVAGYQKVHVIISALRKSQMKFVLELRKELNIINDMCD